MKNLLSIVSYVIFFFIVISCGDSKVSNTELQDSIVPEELKSIFKDKAEKIAKALKNKKVNFLDSLLNIGEGGSDGVFLYYSSIDCSSCIQTGLDFLFRLKESNNTLENGVVLSGVYYENGPLSQVGEFVHDEHAQIQDELGYIITPSLIFYKNGLGISNVYVIPTFEDSIGISNFEHQITK